MNQIRVKLIEGWKEFKKKHPDVVLACVKCNKAVSWQNVTNSKVFKCPSCKETFEKPKFRNRDLLKGHSGKKKRDWTKLLDSKGLARETLTPKQLADIITYSIPQGRVKFTIQSNYIRFLRQNALIALISLTGSRVSEIVGIKDAEGDYIVPPMRRSQIQTKVIDDKEVIVISNLNCIKRKEGLTSDSTGKQHIIVPKRTLWYPYKQFAELYKFIADYLVEVDTINTDDYVIFPISRQTATNYLNRIYNTYLARKGLNEEQIKEETPYLHWLRHSNFTYMATEHRFNDTMMRHYAGWGSAAMANKYVHIKPEDLYKIMLEKEV